MVKKQKKNPLKSRINVAIRLTAKSNRSLIVTHPSAPENNRQSSSAVFSIIPTDRQKVGGENVTSLADVNNIDPAFQKSTRLDGLYSYFTRSASSFSNRSRKDRMKRGDGVGWMGLSGHMPGRVMALCRWYPSPVSCLDSTLSPRRPASGVIFVTKIKTRTRIVGRRFRRTRTRIVVIQKTKTK